MSLIALATGLMASMTSEGGAPDWAEFQVSRLHCIIGNNAAMGEHKAGYNGVFVLQSPAETEPAFVPAYAGLNLEHYFDAAAMRKEREVFFEPRCAPMEFKRLSDTTAELHQPTTPHYGVESWTRFELREPYYVDMTFRCIPRKAGLAGDLLGVFWASYINAPLDKSIYFLAAGSTLDKPVWAQYCTLEHGRDSTVCSETDASAISFTGGEGTLFNSIAPLRYAAPFFYGRFRDQVLIYIFKPGPHVRFSHSPSGGGATPKGDAQNPAWDFQLLVPDYQVDAEYGLQTRLVYKPWVDRADVLGEFRRFLEDRF